MHAYTISSLLPFSTTQRMCWKFPPQSTTVSPKGLLLSRISCRVQFTVPMQYLGCMGTSSQIIATVCLRSPGLRSFLGILQWEVSSTSNGIFSRSVMYGPQVGGLMLCQKVQHIGQSALTTYSRTDGLIEKGLPSTTQPI